MEIKVGIIMGSDSDLPVMSEAAKVLDQFGIPYEITIVSAHRTPERMVQYARDCENKGVRIIIAGAGGAAHLPGMVAALTTVPVIGVPVKSSNLSGVDSLYSIVQMPPGVPVATMAINGAKNAGLFAVSMISILDEKVNYALKEFRQSMKEIVEDKAELLENKGYKDYLKDLNKI